MLNELIKLRNSKQPPSLNNVDAILFDYKFWTELESLTKKHRSLALDTLKSACVDAEQPGIILTGKRFFAFLKLSKPIRAFDKEVFIEKLLEKLPNIPKHVIRECATEAVVETTPRKTYSVEDNDE
jgi:hypothetical protein